MATQLQAPLTMSANDSRELQDAYNADVIQAFSNYLASGKRLSFVSSEGEQGRLVVAFTLEDGPALNDAVTQALKTGVGRRWS